jgi:predicted Fe-Mo cluster-binding NifX family protein
MNVRFAVASGDGIYVNEHFSKTDMFYIYDADYDNVQPVGQRENSSVGVMGYHDEERFSKCLDLIHDVNVVIALKIGPKAKDILLKKGVKIFITDGKVNDAIKKFIKSGKIKSLLECKV